MSSVIERRQKHRPSPPQPIDRHLSEIGEFDGTIYINAGIDSTCKKRCQTIHKLTNGIVMSTVTSPTSTMKSRSSNGDNDDLSPILLNSRTHDDRLYSINNGGCTHCGK